MNPEVNQIEALLNEAHTIRVNNLVKSIVIAEKALGLAEEIQNLPLTAKAFSQLALYNMVIGEMDKATAYSQQAISIFETLQDERGVADAKYSLAGVYYKTNQYHLGLMNFSDALKIYQKYGDYYNQSRTEKSLGTIYEFIGDVTSALNEYKKAIRNAKRVGDFNLESNVYNNLSGVLVKKGKLYFAMKFIEKSIALKEQTKDVRGLAYAIYGKAKVYHYAEDAEKAELYYFKALAMHQDMGENTGIAMTLTKLAEYYYKYKDFEKALEYVHKGLDLSNALQISMSSIKLNKLAYTIYKALGAHDKALCFLENHLKEKDLVINTQTLKVIESYELITKMKSLENEAHLHRERQKLLEKKNQEDLETYRQKQEFLSVMSHEIRTPLNAITTSISLLDDKVTLEGKRMLTNLKFASTNLINIVNDVLAFNKLDSHTAKLERTSVNLNFLCQNSIELFERLANEKKLALKYETNIKITNCYWIDQTKLSQILCNLISNAVKFTDSGQVMLQLELIDQLATKDIIQFKVTDTGEGIKETDKKEIFNSFSQIKPYLTRKQGGTGLGLAIVKKLAELHETEIHLESEPKKGSVFYFQLELEKAEEIHEEISEKSQLKGKSILIVDDTKMNAVLLSKLLKKWELQIDYVNNGMDAVKLCQEKKFDFILMDIHMPIMNGFETSKQIKETKNLNVPTPILALTADILADTDENFAKYFSGIIYKPFEIEKLYSLLRSHAEIN